MGMEEEEKKGGVENGDAGEGGGKIEFGIKVEMIIGI